MTDERAVKLARSAREQLGEALGTLQMEELPLSLFDVTAQVAKAMGLLLRFEQEGDGRVAEQALLAVRTSLGVLQTCNPRVPAVDRSAQAVAGALGLVHSVNELAALPAQSAPSPGLARVSPSNDRSRTQLGHVSPLSADHTDTVREPLSGRASSSGGIRAAQQSAPELNTAKSPAASAPPSSLEPSRKETLVGTGDLARALMQDSPVGANPSAAEAANNAPPGLTEHDTQRASTRLDPSKRAAREKVTNPEPLRAPGSAPVTRASGQPGAERPRGTQPLLGGSGLQQVYVALAAHSPSNFFTGLAGMNVIANGGLFVATYEVVRVGQELELTVSLPGGHEFQAEGTVQWQREPARSNSGGLPPGYGVKFTRISDAGRKLIERYIAHREPFFYDEL